MITTTTISNFIFINNLFLSNEFYLFQILLPFPCWGGIVSAWASVWCLAPTGLNHSPKTGRFTLLNCLLGTVHWIPMLIIFTVQNTWNSHSLRVPFPHFKHTLKNCTQLLLRLRKNMDMTEENKIRLHLVTPLFFIVWALWLSQNLFLFYFMFKNK